MLRRVSYQKAATFATLRPRCLHIRCLPAVSRHRSPFISDDVSAVFMVTQVSARRWHATSSTESSGASGAPPIDEEAVIRAAKWSSSNFEERLGFRVGETLTEERLKRHYYILAKHFHPDTASGSSYAGGGSTAAYQGQTGTGSDGAFQNVKEAYDAIQKALRRGSQGNSNASHGSSRTDFAGGFEYSDEARRRSQMRLLGDAVVLFLFMTLAFIYIVSRHNKSRMQSRYLGHLIWIFFMIQLFPRLLAAAILFAAHSVQLLENATLQEQAAISLIVERSEKSCTVKVDGLRADVEPNLVVQVTTTVETDTGAREVVSSTLTFDKGITKFTLPVPAYSDSTYHIKAVDEARRMVLVDRSLSVGM